MKKYEEPMMDVTWVEKKDIICSSIPTSIPTDPDESDIVPTGLGF